MSSLEEFENKVQQRIKTVDYEDYSSYDDCITDLPELDEFHDSFEYEKTFYPSLKLVDRFDHATKCEQSGQPSKSSASDEDSSSDMSGYGYFESDDDESEEIVNKDETEQDDKKCRDKSQKYKEEQIGLQSKKSKSRKEPNKCPDLISVSTVGSSDVESTHSEKEERVLARKVKVRFASSLQSKKISSDLRTLQVALSSSGKSKSKSKSKTITASLDRSSYKERSISLLQDEKVSSYNIAQERRKSSLFSDEAMCESILKLDPGNLSLEFAQTMKSLKHAKRELSKYATEVLELNSTVKSLQIENQVLREKLKQYQSNRGWNIDDCVQRFEAISQENLQMNNHSDGMSKKAKARVTTLNRPSDI